jgi:hypothetical protein
VKVRYADMTTRNAQTTLAQPTDVEDDMVPAARELFSSLVRPGSRVRLLGFGVSGLGEPVVQMALFDTWSSPEDRERARALARNLDQIRERFGPDAVRRGLKRGDGPRQGP